MTRYAFVRFSVFLVAGILLHELTDAYFLVVLLVFGILLGAYLLLFIAGKTFLKDLKTNTLTGFLGFALVGCFGYLNTFQHTALHDPSNLLHDTAHITFYKGVITAEVREREKFFQTEVEVSAIKDSLHWHPVSGKIMLNVRKSDSLLLHYGDEVLIKGSPQVLPEPMNPQQFNYKKYLARQQIYFQHFIQPSQLLVTGSQPPNAILQHSIAVRHYFDQRLAALIPSEQEYAIATGILLGVKDALDNDLKQAYSSAGAMHILAVSGMHVGLLFEILVLLLGSIRKNRYGKLVFAAVVLLILWFYSFITGLSPSVLRAIVMFSFIVVAQTFNRNTNIYNTLAASAFVLLCINPYLIMDVGFQLSYLAVGGIAYLYNPLYQWLTLKSRVLDFFWKITCVGLAAQVLTFPISLYHFHQFPVYFLLANLVLIPVSTGVMYVGLATLAMSFIPYLAEGVAFLLKWSVWVLNQGVFITESLPGALLTGIDLSIFETLLLYGVIVCLCLLAEYRKFYWMIGATACLAMVSFSGIYKSIMQKNQQEFAIFSISRHPVLGIIEGQHNLFVADSALLANEAAWGFNLKAHWAAKGVDYKKGQSARFEDLKKNYPNYREEENYGILLWNHQKFLFLYKPVKKIQEVLAVVKPDVVVVQHNALRTLKDIQAPQTLFVLDASNSFYNTRKLVRQAHEQHVSLHAVGMDGSFILEK